MAVDERRRQLLELAVELFGDRSYADISVDEIARAAGISKGLLYHYFPGKREYYVAAVRFAANTLIEMIEAVEMRAPNEPDPSLEGLKSALRVYLQYVKRRATTYTTVIRGGLGTDDEVRRIVDEARHRFMARLLVAMGVETPSPRLRIALRGWIGAVEAVSVDWLDNGDLELEEVCESLAGMLAAILFAGGHVGADGTPIAGAS